MAGRLPRRLPRVPALTTDHGVRAGSVIFPGCRPGRFPGRFPVLLPRIRYNVRSRRAPAGEHRTDPPLPFSRGFPVHAGSVSIEQRRLDGIGRLTSNTRRPLPSAAAGRRGWRRGSPAGNRTSECPASRAASRRSTSGSSASPRPSGSPANGPERNGRDSDSGLLSAAACRSRAAGIRQAGS